MVPGIYDVHFLVLQFLKLLERVQGFFQKFLRIIFIDIEIVERINPFLLHLTKKFLSVLNLDLTRIFIFQFLNILIEQNLFDFFHGEFLSRRKNLHDLL